jgi:hypothetical protein
LLPTLPADCWEWIASQLGRPNHQVDSLSEEIANSDVPPWSEMYDSRRPPFPAGGLSDKARKLLKAAIGNKTVGLVVYFRALDRYPGGNADFAVLKFKLGPFQLQTSDKSECKVTWMAYRNWDGSPSVSQRPAEREKVVLGRVRALLLDPLLELIDSAAGDQSVDIQLRANTDSEEYNTEWSSIEVLLYVPPALASSIGVSTSTETFASGAGQEQWPLAFRCHKRAYPQASSRGGAAKGPAKEVLEGASSLFGIGRVDPTLIELRRQRKWLTDTRINKCYGYVAPIFLYE